MKRKCLFIVGIVLAMAALQSCSSSNQEEGLLKKYIQAVKYNDRATMSAIAVEPMNLDAASWSLTSSTPEKAEAVLLPTLAKKEAELKKKVDDQKKLVLDADEAAYVAKQKYEGARTMANKKAMDDAKANYDKEKELHNQLQKEANVTAALAKKEEEITLSSLGLQELKNVRDLNGQCFSKEADIKVKGKDGTDKAFRVFFSRYELKDDATKTTYRGRYLILRFESIN